MLNRADVNNPMCTVFELDSDQRCIVRLVKHLAFRTWPIDKRTQMGAHPGDIPNEPTREVDHVRAEIAQDTIRALAIKPPSIPRLATVSASIANVAVIAATDVSLVDKFPY